VTARGASNVEGIWQEAFCGIGSDGEGDVFRLRSSSSLNRARVWLASAKIVELGVGHCSEEGAQAPDGNQGRKEPKCELD
jgi:hypothetical protein